MNRIYKLVYGTIAFTVCLAMVRADMLLRDPYGDIVLVIGVLLLALIFNRAFDSKYALDSGSPNVDKARAELEAILEEHLMKYKTVTQAQAEHWLTKEYLHVWTAWKCLSKE